MAELEHAQYHRSTRKLPAKVRVSYGALVLGLELLSSRMVLTSESLLIFQNHFGLVVMNDEREGCIFSITLKALRSAGMIPKS